MNDSSRRRLAQIHPTLAARIQTLLDNLTQLGFQVEVVQGLRTFAEQDALFAQGRTRPGMIVTRARGGQSNHNYGLAVDLVPFNNGQPNWQAPMGTWMTIGSEAHKLGLEWGGDWKKFVDKPHIQLPGPSVAQCLSLYRRAGNKLDLVWAEATRRVLGAPPTPGTQGTPPVVPSGETGVSTSHPTLRLKSRGEAVRALQEALIGAGLLASSAVDGIFGQGTLTAVRKFQQSKGLTADGIVGAATWEALLSTPSAMKGIPKFDTTAKTMAKTMKLGGPKKASARKGRAKKSGSKKATKKAAKKR